MSDSAGIPCLWMRGGTSKAAVFLATDLPSDETARNDLLLRLMGSPDLRQIDGIGGGDPLCSKVAILAPPTRDDADVDYLFLQVFVDQPRVTAAQPCGNILAAVGPAAIERGLVAAQDGQTVLRIHMRNTGEVAQATVQTPGGQVSYCGSARIDGVPRTHAPVQLLFDKIAGAVCGTMLPTGQPSDRIAGIACTLIDHGMPVVLLRAADLGVSGQERPDTLEAMDGLGARVEALRLQAGPLMGLGDVKDQSIPKIALLAAPTHGGTIATRFFIPHRVHMSIGVLAAVSVAAGCVIPGTVAHALAERPEGNCFQIEHPAGKIEIVLEHDGPKIRAAGFLRTARKLMDGLVFPAPVRPDTE
ncbi:MAG: 4-oxalomesaconate tautomerase [Rhodobacteraceae bacterium]|nr:MAG: 4-oxalomesaconate tautomerase [Paracoccaceae bacterium]